MPKTNGTLTPELRTSLLNSASALTDFLNNMECGCSYWVDFEGRSHTADIGYVSEFLDDLGEYLKGEWEDEREKIIKTKPKRYQSQILYNNGEFLIYACDSYYAGSDFLKISNLEIPLDDICQCCIIDTFNNVIAYTYKEELE